MNVSHDQADRCEGANELLCYRRLGERFGLLRDGLCHSETLAR